MFSNPYLDLPMREWPTNLDQTQDSNTAPQFGAKSANVTPANGPGIGGGPGGDVSSSESDSSSSSAFGQSLGESLGANAAMSGAKGIAIGAITGDIGLGAEAAVKGTIGGIPSAVGGVAADSLGFGDTTAANMGQIGGSVLGGLALGPVGAALGPVAGGIAGEAIGDALGARGSEQAIDAAENNFGFFGAHLGASPHGMGQGTIGLGVPTGIGPQGVEGKGDDSIDIAVPSFSDPIGPGIGGTSGGHGGAPGAAAGTPGDAVGGAGMGSGTPGEGASGGPGGGGGVCYITTATVEHMDLDDDGPELTTLRWFRDNIMAKTREGRNDIQDYYRIAPQIVSNLDSRSDAKSVYKDLYQKFILPAVQDIQQGQYSQAWQKYKAMVHSLMS